MQQRTLATPRSKRVKVKAAGSQAELATFRPTSVVRLMAESERLFEHFMIEELGRRGFGDIRPAHLNIMQYLTAEGCRLTDIAAMTNLTKQTITQLVAQVEALGYVRRESDPSDGRAYIVHQTEKSVRLADQTVPILNACEARFEEILGNGGVAALRKALTRLAGHYREHVRPPR